MADAARKVMPHPRTLRYFEESTFDRAKVDDGTKSRALRLYEELAPSFFERIPDDLSDAELDALASQLEVRHDIEREERRMHFGAFALVCVLFMMIFVPLVQGGFDSLAMDALLVLLLALLVPYVFVYFGYENRVRAMGLARLRILEAKQRRAEERAPARPDA